MLFFNLCFLPSPMLLIHMPLVSFFLPSAKKCAVCCNHSLTWAELQFLLEELWKSQTPFLGQSP